jgi:hypothetical protein
VLESCDGNQDRAIDLLLGMNDPNFKAPAETQVQQHVMVRRLFVSKQSKKRD